MKDETCSSPAIAEEAPTHMLAYIVQVVTSASSDTELSDEAAEGHCRIRPTCGLSPSDR
jgi:hypothetical protein